MMHRTALLPIFPQAAHSEGPLVIAGPCSAESEEQTLSTARQLAEAGVRIFRAGVWKPRSKPGSFEGRGAEALGWLRMVKRSTGMLVTTEVATPRHLELALEAGIDGVWIGARTAANPFAVQEIADALAALPEENKESLTVMVKNPVNPDLELWIGAIERIYLAGVKRLAAIHRGFSSYGPHLYRNEPRWAIPIELLRRIPGLPMIFDPSHIAGRSDLVPQLARQAMDMDYYGLMIETHCNPREALSDAEQQLTVAQLKDLLKTLYKRTGSTRTESLEQLRNKIDGLDDRLLEILAERMDVSREIGEFKRLHNMPVVQYARYNDLMERRVAQAEKLGLSPAFIRSLLAVIHEESVRQQV